MMPTQNKLNENSIENLAIELFQDQGFTYSRGEEVSAGGDNEQRGHYEQVVLRQILADAIAQINPQVPAPAREDALRQVMGLSSPELMVANKEFHKMLTQGVNVSYQKDGTERGDLVWLVDFDNLENNDFRVVNQFTVAENNQHKRPDVIIFINGLPLVVIELKNAVSENATIGSAYKQLQTYKQVIPSLFTYNSILVISDGLEAKAGTISSGLSRFMTWRVADDKTLAPNTTSQMETMIKAMLNKKVLLDLLRHFIVYEESSHTDVKTGIKTIRSVKKLAAYHQYYAVNKAVDSVSLATEDEGDRKGGVVWHTQGSGKSLSMVFTAGKLVLALNNPTVIVITDRNDLDDQLFDTFAASKQLLRQDPVQAENQAHLKSLLKVASGGVVFTTIQKFQPEEGNVFEELSSRKNIVVIADKKTKTVM
jgi:type I restriction enzyme R subunit